MTTAGDGVFRYRDGIAVAQFVVFTTSLAFGTWFWRTGRDGVFCIVVLAILRLVGAGCMLGTINRDSDGLWAGVFVCEGFGLILLTFLLIGLLERVNHVIQLIHKRWFFVPQLITWAGLGVEIAAFVKVTHVEHPLDPTAYSQAGMGLFCVVFLYAVGLFAYFWLHRNNCGITERVAIRGVMLSLPWLLLRVLYSLIFTITADRTWNAVRGNPTAYLFMTFIPETAIMATCIWTICKLPPMPQEAGPISRWWSRWGWGRGKDKKHTRPYHTDESDSATTPLSR